MLPRTSVVGKHFDQRNNRRHAARLQINEGRMADFGSRIAELCYQLVEQNWVACRSGRRIKEYSAVPSECEILLLAGTSFKIATAGPSPLCWSFSSDPEGSTHCTGCLLLGDCAAAPAFNHTASGELVSMKTR